MSDSAAGQDDPVNLSFWSGGESGQCDPQTTHFLYGSVMDRDSLMGNLFRLVARDLTDSIVLKVAGHKLPTELVLLIQEYMPNQAKDMDYSLYFRLDKEYLDIFNPPGDIMTLERGRTAMLMREKLSDLLDTYGIFVLTPDDLLANPTDTEEPVYPEELEEHREEFRHYPEDEPYPDELTYYYEDLGRYFERLEPYRSTVFITNSQFIKRGRQGFDAAEFPPVYLPYRDIGYRVSGPNNCVLGVNFYRSQNRRVLEETLSEEDLSVIEKASKAWELGPAKRFLELEWVREATEFFQGAVEEGASPCTISVTVDENISTPSTEHQYQHTPYNELDLW